MSGAFGEFECRRTRALIARYLPLAPAEINRYAGVIYGLTKGLVFERDYFDMTIRELSTAVRSEPRVWRSRPYFYGIIVCMKKTLHVDERLLRDAKAASGARTDTETVRLGLEALVRRGAYERLRALRGSEPHAHHTPRRRERASSAKHSAA